MTLLRYLPHFLRSFGKGFLWYSVASQVDKAVHQILSNGCYLQNMLLICTVILRLEVTRDAKCMSVSMDEYVNCLSATEKWLYNAGHVDVVPQEWKSLWIQSWRYNDVLNLGECLNPCSTARDWLTVLFTRLAVLTRREYSAYIEPAWHRCGAFVTMITMVLDTSHSNFPPSRIACGLFMHSLVAVRLLQFQGLCPCFMESMDWEQLFLDSQPE